jgi:predicted  nucleic acid-binding Zn-ribbon protein
MWQELFNLFRQLLTLARDTDRNKTEIENLREEFDDLTKVVQALAHELRRLGEHDAHEREKLALRLENTLLRFERRLPGGKHRGQGD